MVDSNSTINTYYAVGDRVTIGSCSHVDSIKNNGDFRISHITNETITLVEVFKDTFGNDIAIATGIDETDCTISKYVKEHYYPCVAKNKRKVQCYT